MYKSHKIYRFQSNAGRTQLLQRTIINFRFNPLESREVQVNS